MTTDFITVDLAHRDCEECARCVEHARTMAIVTGSTGATETNGAHYATVQRWSIDFLNSIRDALPLSTVTPEPPKRPVVRYITFGLGGPAAGLFTMVVVDAAHPDHIEAARQAAHVAYGREWAFDYSSDDFPAQIKKYRLRMREVIRVEANGSAHVVVDGTD